MKHSTTSAVGKRHWLESLVWARRSWAVVGGLILLALLSWVLWNMSDASDARKSVLPREATAHEGTSAHLSESDPENGRAAVIATRGSGVDGVGVVQEPKQHLTKPKEPESPLLGRIRVWNPEGIELAPAEGRIEFSLHRGANSLQHSVQVENGSWAIDGDKLIGLERISVAAIRINGGYAVLNEGFEMSAIPESRRVELRATMVGARLLRVVDARTGVDLRDVRVARPRQVPYNSVAHPGNDLDGRLILEGPESPLELTPGQLQSGHLDNGVSVCARGYAWALFRLSGDPREKCTVALVPSGGVIVGLRGLDQTTSAEVRVSEAESNVLVAVESVQGAERVEIAGLVPGAYRVGLEVGPWHEHPLVLGEATVEVVAGSLAHIELHAGPVPGHQTASATGLILVPESWEVPQVGGRLKLIGTPMTNDSGLRVLSLQRVVSPRSGFLAFSWFERDLQVGSYGIEVFPPTFTDRLEVSGRTSEVHVTEVPPPVGLNVHIIDSHTGQPVETDELYWSPALMGGIAESSLQSVGNSGTPGQYTVRAPASLVVLSLWDWRYMPERREVDLRRIAGSITLGVTPACGFTLRLMDGESEVAIPSHWTLEPVASSGTNGSVTLQSQDGLGRRFQVSEPGSYSLELPTLDGFLSPDRKEVVVSLGEWLTVDVQLQRP